MRLRGRRGTALVGCRASVIVTRYDNGVGRPRTGRALSAAERMRRYRARRRAAGLRAATSWRSTRHVWSDHRVAEAKSLALHTIAAMRIAANPALLKRARATLRDWLHRYGEHPPPTLLEWRTLLTQPWREVAARSTELSEDAARLRQSSPLTTLLSEADRWRVLDAFRPSGRRTRKAAR